MPSTVTSSPAQQLPTRSPASSTSMVRGILLSSDSSISCTTRLTLAHPLVTGSQLHLHGLGRPALLGLGHLLPPTIRLDLFSSFVTSSQLHLDGLTCLSLVRTGQVYLNGVGRSGFCSLVCLLSPHRQEMLWAGHHHHHQEVKEG